MIPPKDIPNIENILEENKKLNNIIKENDIIIKNLKEENLLLETKNKLLEEIIKKNNLTNSFSDTADIPDKRKTIYYDSKEEIINENNGICLLCNEKTILGNKYCIKHKMEIKKNTEKKGEQNFIPELINNDKPGIYTPPDSPENIRKDFLKEKQPYHNLQNKEINIDNNINENKENIFSQTPTPSKSDETVNSAKSSEKVKKRRMAKLPNIRDKSVFIGKRIPINVLKNIDNNIVYKTIAAETSLRIKLAHEIAELTKRDTNIINYKEIIDYIVSQSDDLDGKAITRLRRKYQRSWDIYDIYGEKLNVLKFSMSQFSEMDDEDYKQWKLYLSEIINTLPKQCNYIYRKGDNKGNICEIYDCKQHIGKKKVNDKD